MLPDFFSHNLVYNNTASCFQVKKKRIYYAENFVQIMSEPCEVDACCLKYSENIVRIYYLGFN